MGEIKGFNRSSNLNVLFDDSEEESNCHPTWEICYFDKNMNILKDFRKKSV